MGLDLQGADQEGEGRGRRARHVGRRRLHGDAAEELRQMNSYFINDMINKMCSEEDK